MVHVSDCHVKARLTLYPTESGGRSHFIKTGFRPNHVFEYVDGQILTTYIGEIQFDSSETIEPGEQKEVSVRFLLVQELEKYLVNGRRWWLHEGARRIGEAVILETEMPITPASQNSGRSAKFSFKNLFGSWK